MRHVAFTGAFYVGDAHMRWERERTEFALVFDHPTRQPVGLRAAAPAGACERCAAASSLLSDVLAADRLGPS